MAPISPTSPTWKVPDDITASLLDLGIVIDDGICCAALIRSLIERIEFLLAQAETRTADLAAATERAEKAEAERNAIRDAALRLQTVSSESATVADSRQDVIDTLRARVAALEGALTPNADTQAAYTRKFRMGIRLSARGQERHDVVMVPWETVREIMEGIMSRAALPTAPSTALCAVDVLAGPRWTVTAAEGIRGCNREASEAFADQVRAELERLECLDRQSGEG